MLKQILMTGLVGLLFVACGTTGKTVKFAILSDLHGIDVPDGKERLAAFVEAANREKVNFAIELGDFVRLDEKSQPFLQLWDSIKGERFHVLGNHDMDKYSKEEYTRGMKMPGRYYSFDRGEYHFIVLDGNNLYNGKEYTPYRYANFYVDASRREFMDPEQMEWLKKDLAATDKKCILFSHQSIDRAMGNRKEVQRILEEANEQAGFRKVILAYSGHNHSNYVQEINGITYIQMNSASYVWIDKPSMTEQRYPEETNRKYSILKYSITYDKPLFGIVTLKNGKMKLKGVQGNFMPPTPEDLKMGKELGVFPLVSSIEDLMIKFDK